MAQAVHLAYFSPTGSTRAAMRVIAQGLTLSIPDLEVHEHDLTLPSERGRVRHFSDADWVVFGMPVYYGRIPALFHQQLPTQGSRTRAACVVVYGDRAQEDALLELRDVATACGFEPVAGAAFVAQHSLSPQLGAGRPLAGDLEVQRHFGKALANRFATLAGKPVPPLSVPGNTPYRAYGSSPFVPVTDTALCTQCGICAACCPVQCISTEDFTTIAPQDCICCRACIKYCPAGSRILPAPLAEQFAQRMSMLAQMTKGNNAAETFGL